MTRPGDRLHTVEGKIWNESEKAIKFQVEVINGNKLPHPIIEWFPHSMIKSIDHAMPGSDEFDGLQVNEWILDKKNLSQYIGKTVLNQEQRALAQEAVKEYRVNTFDDMDDDIPF